MSKKIQLSIAEPCHENWDGMTPVEKGKFCGACQKQVVDFSNMSDRQVAEFFKKPIMSQSKDGAVCGRFMTDQLDRPIEIPRKRIHWLKYFFQIALPAFLVSMKVSAQKTQGKIKMTTVVKDTTKRPDDIRVTMGMVARPIKEEPVKVDTIINPLADPGLTVKGEISIRTDSPIKDTVCTPLMGTIAITQPDWINMNKIIEGIVVDENNQPVPFASIETGKPGEGLMADEHGVFRIRKNWFEKGKSLIFSSAGFEKRKIMAGEEEYNDGKILVRLQSNVLLPEVIVQSIGQVTMGAISMGVCVKGPTDTSQVKKDSIKGDELNLIPDEAGILVYPNPVRSGTNLNLRFKKQVEGYYTFQLLNQSGQLTYQNELWIDAEAMILNVNVPAVAAGSYFLVLTNRKTGKKFSEKIIIQ